MLEADTGFEVTALPVVEPNEKFANGLDAVAVLEAVVLATVLAVELTLEENAD